MKSWSRLHLLILPAFTVLFLASCTSLRTVERAGTGGMEPVIRVLIDSGVEQIKLSSTAAFDVLTSRGQQLLGADNPAAVIISSQASGLVLQLEPSGQTASAGDQIRIVPRRDGTCIYNGIAYAGGFTVFRESGRNMALVNALPLETYLEGVLPHELGIRGPDEFAALEAQAVAARTYALSRMNVRGEEPFDVRATVMDQVYRGKKGANKLASSAVGKTRGMTLEHNGKLAFAYYCSCCGGHTSDIALVWPTREDAPYLKGVRDRGTRSDKSFCADGRMFRWRYSYSGSELGALLRETLPAVLGVDRDAVGYLKNIAITGRSRSGRVTAIAITTSQGTFTVTGDRIRWVLLSDRAKNRILPSTMFDLTAVKDGDTLAFVSIFGGGNGHGVGLCQLGALEMARLGYTFEMILDHYYPGCSIVEKY